MIHHAVVQGSPEWLNLRLGIPTASEFDRIITPAKMEPTSGAARRAYHLKLITELALGVSLDEVTTAAMQNGHDWEPKARAAYEMLMGVDVELCGFCTTDDGMIGASPDGFVGEDGSLEIKSPFKPDIHMGYLLNPASLEKEYRTQVQGQLYVSGRKWTDIISYFGGLPMVRVRVEPHRDFQPKLDIALRSFLCELTDLVQVAKERGVVFPDRALPDKQWFDKPKGDFDLTDADVDAILAENRARVERGARQ